MDINEFREKLPSELQEILSGQSEEEFQAMVDNGRRTLDEVTDFLSVLASMYVLNSDKQRAKFIRWLRTENNKKDAPHKWMEMILSLPEEYFLRMLLKIVDDSRKRSQIRRAFSSKEGYEHMDIMPVNIPGLNIEGFMAEIPDDKNVPGMSGNNPNTGMYL